MRRVLLTDESGTEGTVIKKFQQFIVTDELTAGELIPGVWCEGRSHGVLPDGSDSFNATWNGYFDHAELQEGEPGEELMEYLIFRDGSINGHPQRAHGFPSGRGLDLLP